MKQIVLPDSIVMKIPPRYRPELLGAFVILASIAGDDGCLAMKGEDLRSYFPWTRERLRQNLRKLEWHGAIAVDEPNRWNVGAMKIALKYGATQ